VGQGKRRGGNIWDECLRSISAHEYSLIIEEKRQYSLGKRKAQKKGEGRKEGRKKEKKREKYFLKVSTSSN
jgi:hypothetical protein